MKNEVLITAILKSQDRQYYGSNPTGTNKFLVLWAALDKFGHAKYPDWTGKEVFLTDIYAGYDGYEKKVKLHSWTRHCATWKILKRLREKHPASSWQDILENHSDLLSQEDREKVDFLKLVRIVEDWERFDKARIELQAAFGDGHLKAYFLEKNGNNHLLKKEFWKAEHAWEVFENSDSDFEEGYKQHIIYRTFLERNSVHHSDSITEMRGRICVKKDDLDSFLSGNKEEAPQPTSPEINAETIIKFLEGRGYVSPRLKGLLMYICESTLEKDAGQDKVKEAFYNWLKNNHEKCGFDKKRFEELTSKKRKGHPQSSHEGQYYNDISRIFRL